MNTLQSLALGVRAIAVACDAPRVREALAELLRGHGMLSEPLPEPPPPVAPPPAEELVTDEPIPAAERARAYRARLRATRNDAGRHGARHEERHANRHESVTQTVTPSRDANVTIVTKSSHGFFSDLKSPDLGSPSLSESLSEVVSGSCELFSTVNAREADGATVTKSVTQTVTKAKKSGQRLNQKTTPPSANDRDAVTAWCALWKIPTDHPELDHFLDVFRSNGTPHADWSATWRNFLRNQPRFAAPSGTRRAAPELQPVGVNGRAWKLGEGDGH